MSDPLIQYAFAAGELSPTLYARGDLEKYDLGLALVYNFFVDYRGGISTRPGTQFIDYLQDADKETRLFKFSFSPDTEDTYVLVIGDGWLRFVQDGGFVVESAVVVTGITAAAPGVVTAVAHGFSTGDFVYLDSVVGMTEVNGRLFEIGAVTANTFELLSPWGDNFDTTSLTAYVSGGEASRIYTVSTPWAPEDLKRLLASQRRDEMIFSHPDYKPYKLTRSGATSWTLAEIDFTSRTAAPTSLTLTPSTTGDAGIVFGVTAVKNGVESPVTRALVEGAVNYTATAGSLKITWDIQEADHFNVYRSLVLDDGSDVTLAQELGYLGRALGPQFVDNNIIPDFTRSPPEFQNPFADSKIESITVTAVGTAYAKNDTVSIADPDGSGFEGYPIVNGSGEIIAVVVTNAGSGYTAPVVSFGTSTGSGATATAEVGESTGNNPAANRIFQQRRVYGGTENGPMTLWGSKISDFDNFDVSQIESADDSYEFTLDAELVAPVRHLVPMQGGLIVMSEGGIWQLRGAEGKAVNPTNALADPQSYNGCSFVTPITIDTDILYTQQKGAVVRSLSYNDLSKVFAGIDVSTLSNHFFTKRGEIVKWAYQEEPFKLIWAARANGGMLSFTYVKEQEVFAWAQHWTRGIVTDVLCVQENDLDVVYITVKRKINGNWVKFIERMQQRDFDHVDQYWGVDCGLQTTRTYPAADLVPSAINGSEVTFTASASVFSVGDVGKIIRAGAAKAVVLTYVSGTEITCRIIRDFGAVAETEIPLTVENGDWTLDAEVTTVSGLWHLEGETVSILADGNVQPSKTVEDGSITLSNPASIVTVGLPFTAKAKTLPAIASGVVIEGKRKRVVGIGVRVNETRGLAIGRDEDSIYEMKDRTTEAWGEPTETRSDASYFTIEPIFETDGSIWMEQQYPLPATILGLVLDIEVGDEDA